MRRTQREGPAGRAKEGGGEWGDKTRRKEERKGASWRDGKRGRGSASIQMGAIATGSERSRTPRKGRAEKEEKYSPPNSCKTVII